MFSIKIPKIDLNQINPIFFILKKNHDFFATLLNDDDKLTIWTRRYIYGFYESVRLGAA